MTLDFTRDKIELDVDIKDGAILIVARGRRRKIARFTTKQLGQIPHDMFRVYTKLYAIVKAKR